MDMKYKFINWTQCAITITYITVRPRYDHSGGRGARKNIEFLTDRQTHRQVGVIIVQYMKFVCVETSERLRIFST